MPPLRAVLALLVVLAGLGCGDPHAVTGTTEFPRKDGGNSPSSEQGRDAAVTRDASVSDQDSPVTGVRNTDGGRAVDDSKRDAGSAVDASTASATDASDGEAPPPRNDAAVSAVDAGNRPAGAKFVGNITTRGQVRSDFAMYWDQVTPENEGKWGSVEATRGQMNWSGVDRVHDYAKQHGLVFKQHTFVWGSQQPGWLTGLSASEQKKEVEEWIRLFCERYPDVDIIDVVNEPPPHTTPVYMEALGGAGASGYDWIVQSFKWARQYCPKAVLVLNDYNNIEYGAEAAHFIDIAKKVKAAGAPIDAVGAQSHDAYKLPTDSVKKFIDDLAAETGLPVHITEYDINEADATKQATIMKSQLSMLYGHAAVKGITLWGYVSGATWRPNTGLMSEGGEQRPAMKWLLEFLGR